MSDAPAPTSWVERAVTAVGPPLVLGALGYWYGWERTQALYGYFGLDANLLGFSAQDFVVRSIEAIYTPLAALAVAGIVVALLHQLVTSRLSRRTGRRLGYVLIALAFLALLIGIAGMDDIGVAHTSLVAPLMLCFASALAGYGAFLTSGRADPRRRYGLPPLLLGSIVAIGVLGLFWLTSNYATGEGDMRAQAIASNLARMPEVIVYSRDDLGLDSAGASASVDSADTAGAYHYRYGHLHLLIESAGRYFLLPDSWVRGGGTAIVLSDSSDVRIQVSEH